MSEAGELQYGLQQLAHHNAAPHLPPEQYAFDDSDFAPSGPNSVYGTPEPGNLVLDQYGRGYNGGYVDQYDERMEPRIEGYNTPMHYPNPGDGYYASPISHPTPYAGYTVSSPPTPAASDQSNNSKRKRETRSLARARSASRTSPSPKPKRNKQAKGDKSKVPRIDAPLSELTKDFVNIPVKDMDAWVNRPSEVRQQEVERRKGKITRPMNSFMLYRSAYADRTKYWCTQNNHQVVSSVSGESWPMEPKEIRELYTEYARIERDNHQKAHPGYKFSPSKAGAANRKRKDASEDEEEEPSDLDDLDSEWRPSHTRGTRSNGVKRATPDRAWQMGNGNYPMLGSSLTSNPMPGQSTYHYNNPGKPLPIPMMNENMYGSYYETNVRPNVNHPYTEDVFIRREDHFGKSYGTNTPLIGLPGGHHSELLEEQSTMNTPVHTVESQVDPYLLAHGENELAGLPANSGHEQNFQALDHPDFFAADAEPPNYQDDPTLAHGIDTWGFESTTSPRATDTDFSRWLGQTSDA